MDGIQNSTLNPIIQEIKSDEINIHGHQSALDDVEINICNEKKDDVVDEVVEKPKSKFEVTVDYWMERFFKVKERGTTTKMEFYCGIVQFISCLYILPVVPQQMARAAYNKESSIAVTAAACGIGCIIASFLTNLPFIIAPPTSVSIFLAVYLQKENMSRQDGNMSVVLSGVILVLLGYRPFGRFVARVKFNLIYSNLYTSNCNFSRYDERAS